MNPFSTIRELIEERDRKDVSPKEIVDFYLARIAKYNPELSAVLEVFNHEENENLRPGNGILNGIPGLLKDNMCIQGQIASAGSLILKNNRAAYNSTVFSRLKAAGAHVLGRTNCDEFAMGTTGEFCAYGIAKNPWDLTRVPGGSSSGAASAVAAGLVPWALCSETGGSIRQPASFCGLVGMYPTYGLVSRYGLIAFGSSLDQIGAFTRSVYDQAIMFSQIAGHDEEDSSSLPEPRRDYTRDLDGYLPEGLRIGVIKDSLESDGIDPEIRKKFVEGIDTLENLGAQIHYIDLPNLKYSIAVYFIVSRVEAASNLARIDGSAIGERAAINVGIEEMYALSRQAGFGKEVKRRVLMGNYALSSAHRDFYEQASRVRSLIRAEFDEAFKKVDVLCSPTTPSLAFKFGQIYADPIQCYLADFFTVPVNLAGLPAISFPCGYSQEGLPIGMQFIGPRLSEEILLQSAYAFEKAFENGICWPKNFL